MTIGNQKHWLGKWRQFICLFMAAMGMLLAFGGALGEEAFSETKCIDFLDSGEIIYENPEQGIWGYQSPTLCIEITRHENEDTVWTVADIRTRDGERFRLTPKNPEKRMKQTDYVQNIAAENGVVFATTSDFAHHRIQKKMPPGIIIRDGEIVSKKTRMKKSTKFPNLDTLALFDNGDMRVFAFDEHTAEDYLAMGATDVMAFGPILIRDGKIDEKMLGKYGQYREPRVGIGMIEPGHYISIMVEGRHKGSKGVSTRNLAELFLNAGCRVAFNLDGGKSATMVFMGKQIVQVGEKKSKPTFVRSTAEIFGIGNTSSIQDTTK